MEKPFAVDANGNRTEDISLTIRKLKDSEGKYELKLSLSQTWVQDKNRAFPITIDPIYDTSAEFVSGLMDRTIDTGSGSSPNITSFYQEIPADQYTAGLWHFNEASGNVLDSSGYGNTGTPTGTTVVAARLGNGRNFNGTSDSISLGTSANLRVDTGSFSLETWIKPSANLATWTRGTILAYFNPGSIINVVDDADVEGYHFYNGATQYTYVAPGNLISLDWTHFAVTWDKNSSKLTLYINGKARQTWTMTTITTSTNALLAGRRTDGNYFNGIIDEIRISNAVSDSRGD